MKKETVSMPIYETQEVQTWTQEIEMFITSDGQKHVSIVDAEEHEFNWRVSYQHKSPNLHWQPNTFEFESLEEARKFEMKHPYDFGHSKKTYNLDQFNYPSKLVSYEEYVGCECVIGEYEYGHCQCSHEDQHEIRMVYLDEYKRMLIDHLNSL